MEKNNELIEKLNSYFLGNKFEIKMGFLPGGDDDQHTTVLFINGKPYPQLKPTITMYNEYRPITTVDGQINKVFKFIGQQCDCLNLHRELFTEKMRSTFADLSGDCKLIRERKTYLGNHINNNEPFYWVLITNHTPKALEPLNWGDVNSEQPTRENVILMNQLERNTNDISEIIITLDVIIESEFSLFVFDRGNDFTDHVMLRRVKLKDYNK